MQRQETKADPIPDDNKKGNGERTSRFAWACGILGAGESMVKDERRGRYGFAKSAKVPWWTLRF
jgi:hypothetical protein